MKTVFKNALCSISCIKLCMRRSFSFSSLSVFHVFKAMTSFNSTQYWFWFRAWNSLNGLKSKHYFPYSVCNLIVVCRTYPNKNLVEFRKIFNMSKFKWKMYNVRELTMRIVGKFEKLLEAQIPILISVHFCMKQIKVIFHIIEDIIWIYGYKARTQQTLTKRNDLSAIKSQIKL